MYIYHLITCMRVILLCDVVCIHIPCSKLIRRTFEEESMSLGINGYEHH